MYSFSTSVALRYLCATKNHYLSWITILSIFGVAIGITAMIVVLSVVNGFETELRERFLLANAHVMAYRHPAGVKASDRWEVRFKKDFPKEIKGTSPFIQHETLIKNQSTLQSILIKGIHPAKRAEVQKVDKIVRPPEALEHLNREIKEFESSGIYPETPSIILGVGLLNNLQGKVGDIVQLIAPESDNPVNQFQNFKVIGVYDSGLHHYDNRIGALSIPGAQKLLSFPNLVTGIEIGLHDPNISDQVAEKMRRLYRFTVKEWKSYNQNVFEAMHQEKKMIALLVWLVALVAGFNILTTLFIMVNQKQKEISILKALGATNPQIMTLFLKQSTLIGVIGSTLGVIFAYILGNIIEKYQFIEIPEVYLIEKLPVEYDWIIYTSVAFSGIFVCCIAGLYPAWAATRVSPTEGFTGSRNLA